MPSELEQLGFQQRVWVAHSDRPTILRSCLAMSAHANSCIGRLTRKVPHSVGVARPFRVMGDDGRVRTTRDQGSHRRAMQLDGSDGVDGGSDGLAGDLVSKGDVAGKSHDHAALEQPVELIDVGTAESAGQLRGDKAGDDRQRLQESSCRWLQPSNPTQDGIRHRCRQTRARLVHHLGDEERVSAGALVHLLCFEPVPTEETCHTVERQWLQPDPLDRA